MTKFWLGLAGLALVSVLVSCPGGGGGGSGSPTLTGTIAGFTGGSSAVVRVYAITNPRVNWFDSASFFTPIATGATVIGEGTINAAGSFSVQLPSDTTMALYAQPRVVPSQVSGCTLSSSGSSSANVAQIVVKVENNGTSLGFLTQQSPGADNIILTVPGTYYDIWHYWVNSAFGMQKNCPNLFDATLNFTTGWNNITARTTVSANNISIFDALKTGTLPSTLEWILKPMTVNGF